MNYGSVNDVPDDKAVYRQIGLTLQIERVKLSFDDVFHQKCSFFKHFVEILVLYLTVGSNHYIYVRFEIVQYQSKMQYFVILKALFTWK